MFFAVNNKVETRREERGYEVGQNLAKYATEYKCYSISVIV